MSLIIAEALAEAVLIKVSDDARLFGFNDGRVDPEDRDPKHPYYRNDAVGDWLDKAKDKKEGGE